MPKTLNSLMYTITGTGKDKKPDNRKILVINGIPFYLSTGTSEDREQFIGPQWRENLWMPFAGIDTKPKKEGHISKFGSHVEPQKVQELEKELKEILERVFKKMKQPEGDKTLRSLLLPKYLGRNEIDNQDILLGLAQQLGRFGTIEMMIISMYISPEQWLKNALLNEFRNEIIKGYPQFNHYLSMNLPSLIGNATPKVTITADIYNVEQLKETAVKINKWLKIETQKEEQSSVNISESRGLVSAFLNKNDYHNPEADRIIKEIEEKLCAKLMDESSAFKKPRGDSTRLNKTDRSRNWIVEDLEKEFRKISNETIKELTRDNQDIWKQTYLTKLETAVNKSLANNSLDKYGSLEKLGIALLNIITLIVFPAALIKKGVTGNYFFSTVGKSKEAVEETGQIVKNALSSGNKR